MSAPAAPPIPSPAVVAACCKCKYWTATAGDQGNCKRYPPVVSVPVTLSTHWCGEFTLQPAPPSPPA